MEGFWKELLLQWINCFFSDNPIKTIHDIKHESFVVAFGSEPLPSDDSFSQLLDFLRCKYSKYEFPEPKHESWSDENELYLLAMLLLLHGSVYQPSLSLHQKANQTLPQSMQLAIVKFFEKAIPHGVDISREGLMHSIPSAPYIEPPNSGPSSPLPQKAIPQGTSPLADFLSSPVARQSRRYPGHMRERITQLESDLENEQLEKEKLTKHYETKIVELVKQLENKCSEARSLEEYLAKYEEDAEGKRDLSPEQEDRRKLREEVKNLNQYIAQLERDIEDLHISKESLQRKMVSLEKQSNEWENRACSSEEKCIILREEVTQLGLDNKMLRAKCSELEACHCSSPLSPSLLSPTLRHLKSPSSAPESLGPIIEMQLIEKEKENEELHVEVSELQKKLNALQLSCEDLQSNLSKERESSARVKTKFEKRLKELDDNIARFSTELMEKNHEKELLMASLKDIQGKYEAATFLFKDASAARDSAAKEVHDLLEEKHALEVKVALLNAKLQIAEESQEELNQTLSNRSSEIATLRQGREDLVAQMRCSIKDRDKMEQNLNDVLKKRDFYQEMARKMEVEKENLEEKVCALSEQCTVKDKQAESSEILNKKLQEELQSTSQAKESLFIQLQSVISERDAVSASCTVLNNKIANAFAEIVTLNEEKVRLEAMLKDTSQQRDEFCNVVSKLREEKDSFQDKLHETLVENERSSCKIAILTQENGDLKLELQKVEKQKKSLEKQLTESNQKIQNQENVIKISLSKLSENETLCVKFSSEIKELNAQIQQLTAVCDALSSEKDKLVAELMIANDTNAKYVQEVAEIHQSLLAAQTEILSLNSRLDVALQSCDEKSGAIEELSLELSNIEADLTDHVNRLVVSARENSTLKDNLMSVSNEITLMKQQRDILTQENDNYAIKIKELKEEKNDMQKELDNLTETKIKLLSETTALSTELKRSFEDLKFLKESYQALQEDLEGKCQNLAEMKKRQEDTEIIHNSLVNSKLQLEGELVKTVAKFEASVSEKDELLQKALQEKGNAMLKAELLEKDKESISAELKLVQSMMKEICSQMESKEALLSKLNDSMDEKENIICDLNLQLKEFTEKNEKLLSEIRMLLEDKKDLQSQKAESHAPDRSMLKDLDKLQKELMEEKHKLSSLEVEITAQGSNYEQKIADLNLQLSAARSHDKLAQLQQDEYFWQLDRIKNHLEFRLDEMMSQKYDVEEHLSQLRAILHEVTTVCDNLFVALPANCDAVHEISNMKKEVEGKLRAVDKKYAESLCSIIKVTYDVFKWVEKETQIALSKENCQPTFFAERDDFDNSISAVCDVMTSLLTDVRAVINSCKFLSERCESYLKAQTRESLQIKTQKTEFIDVHCHNYDHKMKDSSSLSAPGIGEDQNGAWFGGASTVEEGYLLLNDAYGHSERQLTDACRQLEQHQLDMKNYEQCIAELQAKVNALMLRPSQEQIDQKVKELHSMYAEKLEGMKLRMKQVVNEEVQKVEREKAKSEEEIISRYSNRISEFEEHIQVLSSQLWKLGEKLLQEEQNHRDTQSQLAALKERQLQFITMSKQKAKSLDRLDLLLQGGENSSLVIKTHASNQQKSRGQSCSSLPKDSNTSNDMVLRQTSKMAPASMGLAFPEEDEDGEIFNNDYLTELKEGKCRIPGENRRLSELQYRNSLCPPHLKSSYPLETQYQDPKVFREEELKGHDEKLRRSGKDRGTTSYKKPGPPTPSRRAGRLSLQGKEDLTPHAVLREHNESQTSYGSGVLRAARTTPSRLKALFTSSKVANLPAPKKDENFSPGTPSSKRLSIFRRRFGSNKESQSMSSGYSSLR